MENYDQEENQDVKMLDFIKLWDHVQEENMQDLLSPEEIVLITEMIEVQNFSDALDLLRARLGPTAHTLPKELQKSEAGKDIGNRKSGPPIGLPPPPPSKRRNRSPFNTGRAPPSPHAREISGLDADMYAYLEGPLDFSTTRRPKTPTNLAEDEFLEDEEENSEEEMQRAIEESERAFLEEEGRKERKRLRDLQESEYLESVIADAEKATSVSPCPSRPEVKKENVCDDFDKDVECDEGDCIDTRKPPEIQPVSPKNGNDNIVTLMMVLPNQKMERTFSKNVTVDQVITWAAYETKLKLSQLFTTYPRTVWAVDSPLRNLPIDRNRLLVIIE